MANEFVARNGLIAQDNSTVSGSLIVTNGVTGSLLGTASYSTTASYAHNATSASFATQANSAFTASSADNLTVRGTLTAQTIVVQTITSSISVVTGSMTVSGSLTALSGVTGSLLGTASWANNATSASYALNAANAFIQNGNSFGTTALLGTNDAQNLQFETNGTVRMTITGSDGNVGIGTTSPSTPLQVFGTIRATRLNATGGFVDFDAQTGNNFIGVTSGNMSLANNGTVNLYISGSGNVGIGSTSPASKLVVVGKTVVGSDSSNALEVFSSGDTEIGFSYATRGNIYSKIIGDVTDASPLAGEIAFQTAQGGTLYERVRINKSGSVGIGTNAPSSKLHIDNAIGSDVIRISDAAGSVRFSIGQEAAYAGNYINTRNIDFKLQTYFAGGSGGNIIFQTQNNGTDTVIERMRINTSGSVGIGTNAPASTFHVNGNTTIGYSTATAAPSNGLIVSGNVGIGTTSPGYPLDVRGTGTIARITDGTSHMLFYAGSNLNEISAVSPLLLTVSGSERMRINTSGSVGIGTTAPTSRLEVRDFGPSTNRTSPFDVLTLVAESNDAPYEGWGGGIVFKNRSYTAGLLTSARARSVIYFSGNPGQNYGAGLAFDITPTTSSALTEAVRIKFNGDVGIGTDNPAHKLDIWTAGQSIRVKGASTGYTQGSIIFQSSTTDSPEGRGLGVYNFNEGTDATWFFGNGYGYGDYFVINRKTGSSYDASAAAPAESSNFLSISNIGNVGIGSAIPASKLHLSVGNVDGIRVQSSNSGYLETGKTGGARWRWTNEWNAANVFELLVNNLAGGDPTTTLLTVNSSGNLGIGTISPASKLHVNNNVTIGYSTATAAPNGGLLISGSVGVGTTAPAYSLQLGNTGAQYSMAIIGSTTAGIEIRTNSAGGRIAALEQYFGTEGSLWLYDSNTVKILFRASGSSYINPTVGNLGVGTANPTAKLHIVGSGNSVVLNVDSTGFDGRYALLPGLFTVGTLANGYPEAGYNFGTSGSSYTKLSNDTSWAINYGNGSVMSFKYAAASVGAFTWTTLLTLTTAGGLTATSFTGSLLGTASFATNVGSTGNAFVQGGNSFGAQALLGTNDVQNLAFETSGSVRMIISGSNGRVGIGTTIMNEMLVVRQTTDNFSSVNFTTSASSGLSYGPIIQAGTTAADATLRVFNQAGTSPYLYIQGDGNVGIGTSTPDAELKIESPSADVTGNSLAIKGSGGKEFFSVHKLGFIRSRASDTNGANMHFFDNAGNKRVELSVTSTTMNWYYDALASTFMVFQHSTGNVGIGTTAPTATLHVSKSGAPTVLQVDGGEAMTGGWNRNSTFSATYPVLIFNSANTRWGGIGYDYSAGMRFWISASSSDVPGTSTALLNLLHGGYVGIGTTASNYRLRVEGQSYYSDTLWFGSGGNLSWTNGYSDGTTQTFTGNSIALITAVAGSPRLFISSSGNVGIGLTTPLYKLHVADSGVPAIGVFRDLDVVSVGPAGQGIDFGARSGSNFLPGAAIYGQLDNPGSTGGLTFQTRTANSLTTKMFINSSGNVGINSTSPARKLDVNGTSIFRDFTTVVSSNGNAVSNITWLSTDSGIMNIYTGGSATVQLNSSGISYFNGGSVGIGTAAPSASLHIYGTATIPSTSGNSGSFAIGTTNGVQLFVGTYNASPYGAFFQTKDANNAGPYNYPILLNPVNGNVGVGTTNPAYKLHVSGTSALLKIDSTGATFGNPSINLFQGAIDTILTATNTGLELGTYSNHPILFKVNNTTEAMRIVSGGNVGVGTTNPKAKFHVLDSANFGTIAIGNYSYPTLLTSNASSGEFRVDNRSSAASGFISFYPNGQDATVGSEAMRVATSGNVGIGTTIPFSRLHIEGSSAYLSVVDNASYAAGVGGAVYLYGNYRSIGDVTVAGYIKGSKVNSTNGDYGFDLTFGNQTYTGGVSEKMRILSTGNTGIGTTAPTTRLEVRATAPDADRTLPFDLLTLVAEQGNAPYEGFGGGIVFKNRSYTAGMLTSARFRSVLYFSGNPGQNYGAGLAFDTTPTTSSALTEAVRIKYDGNVGIGVTNPLVKLDVNGSVYVRAGGVLYLDTMAGYSAGVVNLAASTNLIVPSGRIGISTTLANYSLVVNGSINAGYVLIGDTGNGANSTIEFTTGTNSTSYFTGAGNINYYGTGNLTLCYGGGKVGIGGITPQYKLDVNGGTGGGFAASFGGSISPGVFSGIHFGYLETGNTSYRKSALVFERTDNHSQGGNASGKIYMLLDNRSSVSATTLSSAVMTWDTDAVATLGSARVGIASNSPAYALDVNGTIRATGDVIAYSDARVKENVKTITNALDKVTSLRGVTYNRIDSKDKSRKVGVIAQEILEVLPEVVTQDPENGNYNVAYGNIVGVLIEAIKEQQRQIDDLKYLLQTQNK